MKFSMFHIIVNVIEMCMFEDFMKASELAYGYRHLFRFPFFGFI